VVLASEGYCLCGVDVAAPQQLRYGNKPLADTLQLMRPQLVESEVRLACRYSTGQACLGSRRLVWLAACKGSMSWCVLLPVGVNEASPVDATRLWVD
jgi:hypothetical protein